MARHKLAQALEEEDSRVHFIEEEAQIRVEVPRSFAPNPHDVTTPMVAWEVMQERVWSMGRNALA